MSADNDNPDDNNGQIPQPKPYVMGDAPETEVELLKAEVAALKDRALRAMADTENLRKRAEREKTDATQYAITRFARDILSVADNLGRALQAVSPEERAELVAGHKAVIEGVEATERELQAIFSRNGVKPIDPKGEKFDPHFHQAIAEVPGSGQAPGTVVSVVQTGYRIGDRLLRPAMVTVAKADGGSAGGTFDQKF
jgi:molecular chaperone GrpE